MKIVTFLLTTLLPASIAWADSPCGQKGSIPDRIRDCNTVIVVNRNPVGFPLHLAAEYRIKPKNELKFQRFVEAKTQSYRPEDAGPDAVGLPEPSWAMVMRTREGHEYWEEIHTKLIWSEPFQNQLTWDQAKSACAKMSALGKKWSLPSVVEYNNAEWDGIRIVLDMANPSFHTWWTSVRLHGSQAAYAFDGQGGFFSDYEPDTYHAVRCVTKGESPFHSTLR